MLRGMVIVALPLLILGGSLFQRSVAHRTAGDPITSAPPVLAVEPTDSPRVRLPLDLDAAALAISDAQEARQVTAWWLAHAHQYMPVEEFRRLYRGVEQADLYRADSGSLVLRFPPHGTHPGGWAEFSSDGRLIDCDASGALLAPGGVESSVTAAERARVALACHRLAAIDSEVLAGLLLSWDDELPSEGWRNACGNWMLDARTYEDQSASHHNGRITRSSGGRRLAVSLGEDGVLHDFSVRHWRTCSVRISCGTRRHQPVPPADEAEPPLPVANN
jgi:hypothetical protein